MPEKLAFGTTAVKFQTTGIYPNFDKVLVRENNPNLAPTTYNPREYPCTLQRRYQWGRKKKGRNPCTESYSQYLKNGLKVRLDIPKKEAVKGYIGPGTYNIKRDTFKTSSHAKDKGFSSSQRFEKINDHPGPGTYEDDIFKYSSVRLRHKSTKSTFERDAFKDRFALPTANLEALPPTVYRPKCRGSIQALIDKVVSKRGPYDLFTGPRDDTTIKNHFSYKTGEGADVLYPVDNVFDYLLKNPKKKWCGAFAKEHLTYETLMSDYRFLKTPHVKMQVPGPGAYEINWHTIKPKPRSNIPFGSNAPMGTAVLENVVPGPGRYYIKHPSCHIKKQLPLALAEFNKGTDAKRTMELERINSIHGRSYLYNAAHSRKRKSLDMRKNMGLVSFMERKKSSDDVVTKPMDFDFHKASQPKKTFNK